MEDYVVLIHFSGVLVVIISEPLQSETFGNSGSKKLHKEVSLILDAQCD